MINVTIFNEFVHEKTDEKVKEIYPEGIHTALKNHLQDDKIRIKTFTLENINDLTSDVLDNTDVIIWWGHLKHHEVPDEVSENVCKSVHKGMGAIFLHSAHFSKPFMSLMGTPCNLTWREDGDYELVWNINPAHPITRGIDRFIKLDCEETYGEPFGIPEPDQLVFIGNFECGEVFRSGCCYQRGNGRVFYFQPGHETCPTYHNENILRVIKNAIYWAKPVFRINEIICPEVKKPMEE